MNAMQGAIELPFGEHDLSAASGADKWWITVGQPQLVFVLPIFWLVTLILASPVYFLVRNRRRGVAS